MKKWPCSSPLKIRRHTGPQDPLPEILGEGACFSVLEPEPFYGPDQAGEYHIVHPGTPAPESLALEEPCIPVHGVI